MMKQSQSQLSRHDFASRRRLPWHFVSPTDELRRPASQAARRAHRSVLASQPSRLCFRKRATKRCQASCAPKFQSSLVDGRPLAPPIGAPHRPPPPQFAGRRRRSLPLSQSGTRRSHLSILRAFRRKVPWNNHSTPSVRHRSAPLEQGRRISRQRIAGCLCASSLPRTAFPSMKRERSR